MVVTPWWHKRLLMIWKFVFLAVCNVKFASTTCGFFEAGHKTIEVGKGYQQLGFKPSGGWFF
jgi:hypothetical protein